MTNIKKNAIYNTIKTLLSVALPLITFPYVSKTLLPSNLGKVNWSSSFVEYFSLIASLGISTYAIRKCSSARDDKDGFNDIASQLFSVNLITTIISYVLLFLILFIFKEFAIYRTLVIIQSITIVLTTFGADWINQAMEDFKFITLRTIACQFAYLICVFLFIKGPDDYIKYAIISVVTSSGCYIVNIFYIRKYCKLSFTLSIDWNKHIKPIMQLFVMQLAQVVVTSAGVTILGLMRSDYEVGIYTFAFSIMNMMAQLIGSILWVLLPRLSYLFSKNDYDSINILLSDIFCFFMLLGLPCATGIIVLSKEIVMVFSSEAYLDAIPVIIILMLGFLASLVGDSFLGNMVLLPSGKEEQYMKINCVGAIFNTIANLLLVKKYGYIGVALVDLLTNILITILIYSSKDRNISIGGVLRNTIVPLFGCAVIVAVCCIGKVMISSTLLRVIICVPVSVITYFALMILMKNTASLSLLNDVMSKINISIKK